MILVLLGAPGAGKGTQADILSEMLGIVHVSSGDLLREHRRSGTALGKLADTFLDRGELVPDDVVIGMVTARLAEPDAAPGVILDGFPRTVAQADALDTLLAASGKQVDKALYVQVPSAALLDRLSGRWICRNCQTTYHEKFNPPPAPGVCGVCGGELYQREDDRREVVERRLEVYFAQTLPVIEYYRQHCRLLEVDGDQPIEDVTRALIDAIRDGPDLVGPDLVVGTAA